MQLVRDLQLARILAGLGGVLVDPVFLDYETTNRAHDSIQVRSIHDGQDQVRWKMNIV